MAFYSLFAPARIPTCFWPHLAAGLCATEARQCVCRVGKDLYLRLYLSSVSSFPRGQPNLIMDTVSDACGGERGDFGFTAYPLPKPAWRAVRLLEARGTGRRPCSRCASLTAPKRGVPPHGAVAEACPRMWGACLAALQWLRAVAVRHLLHAGAGRRPRSESSARACCCGADATRALDDGGRVSWRGRLARHATRRAPCRRIL